MGFEGLSGVSFMRAGDWARDRRHGWGVCRFADGAKFRGEWEDDAWVQSLADPGRCRAKGPGLSRAVAGAEAAFLISVHALYHVLQS